jgi:hypothetical protein
MRGGVAFSSSLFNTSLSHPYVFCTTLPSLERVVNQGEWSFISPVGSAQVRVRNSLVHDLTQLKKSGAILTGAVSPRGRTAALVERHGANQGRLVIMPIVVGETGGLSTLDPVILNEGALAIQDNEKIMLAPTAVRFHKTNAGCRLVAVDTTGKAVKKQFRE